MQQAQAFPKVGQMGNHKEENKQINMQENQNNHIDCSESWMRRSYVSHVFRRSKLVGYIKQGRPETNQLENLLDNLNGRHSLDLPRKIIFPT